MLREEGELQLARHLQFLLHLRILFAQLAGAFFDALFELRVEFQQLFLREIARVFRAINPAADQE